MSKTAKSLRAFLDTAPSAALVEVTEAKGSTPREKGAWMLVSREHIFGTIGGGQLEFMAIDIGQIEGGFVQGAGWLTTEELWWDGKGRLRTHAPSTYKIPLASDRPKIFNVALTDWSEAYEPTIHRSKAVGEPPLPLGIAVLQALSDAVASVADHKVCPRLDAPATPERVLMAIERLRAEAAQAK